MHIGYFYYMINEVLCDGEIILGEHCISAIIRSAINYYRAIPLQFHGMVKIKTCLGGVWQH